MSNLIVTVFGDEDSAQAVLMELATLHQQKVIVIDDAAMVVRHTNGKVKLTQANNLVGPGTLGGAFWGLLVGMLFLAPVAGAALGGLVGAGLGTMSDYGINGQFIKEVSSKLEPGTSALFVLVCAAQKEPVLEHIRPYRGQIIHTVLSPAEVAELRAALT